MPDILVSATVTLLTSVPSPCSGDIFDDQRGPAFSFNHVTSPYGYTLSDLVSYT
jgi:hypothetical protein